MKVIILVFVVFDCLIAYNQIDCLSNFIRGRRFSKHLNQNLKLSNITDQYYDQRLDHFNEANRKTWKQVNFEQIQVHFYFLRLFFRYITALLGERPVFR
jgi:hypothetical protein